MTRFIAKRLLQAVPLLIGIATITFFIVHLAPGDPMDMYLEPRFRRQVDPETIELIRQKYGLDQPIHVSILALLFDALFGIALGILAAVKQYSTVDKTVTVGSLAIYSIPGFWLALMLVLLFSVQLGWFPTSQTRSLDYDLLSSGGQILDRLWHLVLPVFVLGVASAAGTARYMRNRLLEVLSEDYVLAARARGLSERRVILKHALRNALIPIVTIYGLSLPFLLGGAVLIEQVFAWPGMGLLAVEAVGARDYPVILATSMIAAVLVVLGNLLADVTYALVDPRVSYDESKPQTA